MKLQQETISYLLIFLIAIAIVSVIIYYYLPYIKKMQDEIKVKTIFSRIFDRSLESSLAKSLQKVIFLKEFSKVEIGYDVFWNLTSKSIEAKFYSSVCPTNPNDQFVFLDGCTKSECYVNVDLFYKVEVKSRKVENECEITDRLSLVDNLKLQDKNVIISFVFPISQFSSKFLMLSLSREEIIGNNIYYDIKIEA